MGTDIHLVAEYYKDGRWHLSDVELPDYRNYRAFAVLADVRNGYAFAGFDTGDPVDPISYPRGLPDDLSQELQAILDNEEQDDELDWDKEEEDTFIWLGDHSFSWVTLKELLDYDLDAPVTLRGKVPPEVAFAWKENGEPPRITAAYSNDSTWVSMEWQQPIRQSAPLIQNLIDALLPLGDPAKVRIVFGFDS